MANCDIHNEGARKVLEACGFQYEGSLRQSVMNNQGICDYAYYSIIRKDYFKV